MYYPMRLLIRTNRTTRANSCKLETESCNLQAPCAGSHGGKCKYREKTFFPELLHCHLEISVKMHIMKSTEKKCAGSPAPEIPNLTGGRAYVVVRSGHVGGSGCLRRFPAGIQGGRGCAAVSARSRIPCISDIYQAIPQPRHEAAGSFLYSVFPAENAAADAHAPGLPVADEELQP